MRYGLGDRVRRLVPTMAADAVADHGGPIEGIALARRKAVPADRNPLADTGEGWHHRKRTRRRQPAHALLPLLRYRRRQHRSTRGNRKVQHEARPVGFGALLHVAVGKVNSPCNTSITCRPGRPMAEIVNLAVPAVVTADIQPVKLLS